MEHHVFLSHSDVDTAMADRIGQSLQARGLTTWQRDTGPVDILLHQDMYEKALREAGCVVIVLSPGTRQSRSVREQTRYAARMKIPLVAALIGGEKGDSTPPDLSHVPYVSLEHDYEAGLRELAFAIQGLLNIDGAFQRRLSFSNPLDQMQLLRWLYLEPGQYLAYQAYAGSKATRLVGSWLASSLTWLPLIIATIGFAVSISNTMTAVFFGALLVLSWLMDSLLGPLDDDALGVLVGVAVFFLCLSVSFALTGGQPNIFALVNGTALVVAAIISAATAHIIAGAVARSVALGSAVGTSVGVAVVLAGLVTGGVLVAIAFALAIVLAYFSTMGIVRLLRHNLNTRRPSSMSRLLLAALGLVYVILVLSYFVISRAVLPR